jgi:hypothetical protein
MGQQFCTVCGAKLGQGIKFCESCGAPVELSPDMTGQPPLPGTQVPGAGTNSSPPPARSTGKFSVKIITGIVIVLIIAAAAAVVLLPKLKGGDPQVLTGLATPVPSVIQTTVVTPTAITTTTVPTPTPDPFPDAYPLRGIFSFNEGKYASKATVYRYWINETYHWHNDMDNHYYTSPDRPHPGFKYLIIFVNIENVGSDGYPYPKTSMITVHYDGNTYRVDTSHYLPNKAGDKKATPVEIQEIEQQSDFFNLERVEDYGYSHGTTQDFVFPGQGNAIDGYVIYEVPVALTPDKTYIEIVFDGQDKAVWKLA